MLIAIPGLGGGGAERQLSYLAPRLATRGVRVHIAYIHDGEHRPPLSASGVPLTKLAARHNYDPTLLWRLLRLVKHLNPDIVHTWLPQMDIIAGFVAVTTGKRFVLSERSSAGAYVGGWKDRVRLALGHRADAVVANSLAGCDYWTQNRASQRCTVIRNAVPCDEIACVDALSHESLGLAPDTEVIVFAGRYSYEKNLPNLLRALDLALARRPHAVALLFGNGPLRAAVDALVRGLPTGQRIHVRSFTSHLWGALKRAHVFVSASTFEGQPNTVMEAVAAGCPLVLSDIAPHREFLDERCAFYAPAGDPEALATALTTALENRELARLKHEHAARALAECSPDAIATKYLQLYESVLSQRLASA